MFNRPETGPMYFGEDWPGVFIRGDNAMYMTSALNALLKSLDDHEKELPEKLRMTFQANYGVLNWIQETLNSCIICPGMKEKGTTNLKDFKECVDKDE